MLFRSATTVEPTHGTLILADGRWLYLPLQDWHGRVRFVLRHTDDHGGATDQEFVIDVLPVEDAPVVQAVTMTMRHDEALTLPPMGWDPDGDELVTAWLVPTQDRIDVADGGARFHPPAGFVGIITLTCLVTDRHGPPVDGALLVQVTAPPPPPASAAEEGGNACGAGSGIAGLLLALAFFRRRRIEPRRAA